LIEDNSARGKDTLLLNVRAAWTPRKVAGMGVYAELLNVLDSKDDNIDFLYATRFPGEPAEGIVDDNRRIVEPRQVRIGVKKSF